MDLVQTMNQIPLKIRLAAIFCLTFLLATIALYYVPHKPFDLAFLLAILNSSRKLIISLALLALAGGIGFRIAGPLHSDRLANLVIQVAFGLGLSSIGLLVWGLLGLYRAWSLWTLLILPLIFLYKDVGRWLKGWEELWQELRRLSGFQLLIAGLIGIAAGYALLQAWAPPAQYDALVYHLMLPSRFLEAGGFVFVADNPFWGMPLSAEMLYTWAIGLGGYESATLLGWMLGLLAIIGTLAMGRTLSRRVGWVSCAALLAGETIASSLGWGYVDWGAALMAIAALLVLDAWRATGSLRLAVFAGIFAGFAFGFKYTAAIVIPAGAMMLLVSRSWRSAKGALGLYLLASILAASFWPIKNLAFAGEILYPYLGSTPWVDATRQWFYRMVPSYGCRWGAFFTPLAATFEGVEGAPGFSASIGPLMAGLTPGLLLAWRSHQERLRGLLAFILVGWLLWSLAALYSPLLGQSRLYYVLFPAWAVLAGAGFEGLAGVKLGAIRMARVAGALVLLGLIFSILTIIRNGVRNQAIKVLVGMESNDSYLMRHLGTYLPAMQAIEDLGPDAYILTLWEPRGLYCRPNCLADVWIDRWFIDRRRMTDADLILQAWQQEGFTHLLVHAAGIAFVQENDARYGERDWETLEQLLQELEMVAAFGEGYQLFRLPP